MATIYVGNVSRSITTLADLENLFAPFGQIKEANLIRHKQTGLSEGYGFICFVDQEAAKAALIKDGEEFQGRLLTVSFIPFSYLVSKVEALLEVAI